MATKVNSVVKKHSPARTSGLKKRLSEMETRLRRAEAVLLSSAAPTFVVDKDLLITSVNDAALTAMGYSRDEVVGKMTCARFSRTPLCGTPECTIINCMRTGRTIIGETTAETREGKKIPVKASCSPLMDDHGNAYGGMEVIVDQTDVVRATWKTENILSSIAAPMFVVDTDLTIQSINDAALKAMGYRRDEVVGKMTCASCRGRLSAARTTARSKTACGTDRRSSARPLRKTEQERRSPSRRPAPRSWTSTANPTAAWK